MRDWGRSAAQSPRSVLPRTACTGAIRARARKIRGSPISPAWMMSSTPLRAWSAWGRSKPWVSEMTPMRCSVMKAQQGRGGPGMIRLPGEKLQPAYAPPGRGRLILVINQPDQTTQAFQAHPVLGVHLGHFHQGGKEWKTPDLFLQLFAQLLVMTGQKLGLLGFITATAGALRHRISPLWLTTVKCMAIAAIILNPRQKSSV